MWASTFSFRSLLWPNDTKLGVLVAYFMRQLEIATQMSVIEVKVIVAKIEFQFPLNNLSLYRPMASKLSLLVVYIKRQLGITTQMWSRSLLLKKENQFPLSILSFLWTIVALLGLWATYIKRQLRIPPSCL